MDKEKLENINIAQNKELFEYEMTEVILNLKGEFAVISSQVKPRSIEAVDLEKLIPSPVPKVEPVKMAQEQPGVIRVPPKSIKLQMPVQCQVDAAPAGLNDLVAQTRINPKAELPVCPDTVQIPVPRKVVIPPPIRPIPKTSAVCSDAAKPLSKLVADAVQAGKTHLPVDTQISLPADQYAERLSRLSALSLLPAAAGMNGGTKRVFAFTMKPNRIVAPRINSLSKPIESVDMAAVDSISLCPIKAITIPDGKVQLSKAADVGGLNGQNRAQQWGAMHAKLLSAARSAAAADIEIQIAPVELPPKLQLPVSQHPIAPVTIEKTVSVSTLKADMQRMYHHTPICLKTEPVSVKQFTLNVRLPDISAAKPTSDAQKEMNTDFAAPLQEALRSAVVSSKIGTLKSNAQNK